MLVNRLLWVAFVVVSGACGVEAADTTFDITYDPCHVTTLAPVNATASEQTSIGDAIEMWNQVGGPVLTLSPSPGAQVIPIEFERAAPAYYGVYRDELGDVVVNRELTDPHQRAVTIAHELGHAFGLRHSKDDPTVMRSGNLSVEPTHKDTAALQALWGQCATVPELRNR